ncbi:1340_t:CDS:2, partial [Ambispora gerdemannii]
MTSVASLNPFELLEDDAEEVDIIVEGNRQEPTSTSATESPVIKHKVDRSRASRIEARIRHEYPQRGGFNKSAPPPRNSNNVNNNNSSDARIEEPRSALRDRNVGPRLAGRRDREEGGSEFPSRTPRGARAGEHLLFSDSEKKEQAWGNATNSYTDGGAENETWNANEKSGDAPGGSWGGNAKEDTNATGGDDKNAGGGSEWNTETPAEGGATNWDTNDGVADTTNWKETKFDTETNQDNSGAAAAGDLSETAPPVAEEVVKTLDEYLAEKKQKATSIALPEIRKPNEGVDDPKWKDAVPLQKEEEEDFLFVGK